MDTKMLVELIGYTGSALVVVSMLMTSVVRLRVINTVGCVIFAVYALIIHSYPTAAMNLCLMGINLYHLLRLFREQKQYDLIEADPGDGFVSYIIEKYLEDIRNWFPAFSFDEKRTDTVLLVCCDGNPAGVFLGRKEDGGKTEVLLDYTTPVYRDTTVGKFLHGSMAGKGMRKLVFRGNAPKHVPYMKSVGYRETADGVYELTL